MGCISSKILTKSLSFREDLNQRSKRNSKLQAGDFASPPKSALEPTNTEIINTWKLMAGLEEQAEHKLGVGRSRSFHTVEEYDAMMQRIMLSRGHNDDYDSAYKLETEHLEHNVADIHEIVESSFSRDKYSIGENTVPLTSEPDIKEALPSNTSCIKFEVVNQERKKCDVGLKRKAMAKGLERLQIPSTVEFHTRGSLRDGLHNGGRRVNSPGEYVTPKFGNYYSKPKSELGER